MSLDPVLKNPRPAEGEFHINYEEELNSEQLKAATAEPGPLLMVAGAGSGKTRALTYRVAWLIENGAEPESILLLTFTNKAAREMLDRVAALLPYDISRLWGGTFHHVGNRLLRRHSDVIGSNRNFTIHDREDSVALMRACMEEAGITGKNKDKRFPKPDVIIQILSLGINTQKGTAEILKTQFTHLEEFANSLLQLEKVYQRKKREANAVDYDDLLTLPLQIFREHPEILERYQNQFLHVLVDEYQDTNILQAEFVDSLAGRHQNITVVGDDSQSIYSWRGANFANIVSFQNRYPEAEIIRLETNYRSTPEILELANHSIAHNEVRIPKNLHSVRTTGVKPAVVGLGDARQQANFVTQRVFELMEEGTNLSDIAVLYRSHFHSMELQMELTRRKIPFQITSGLRFFEQAHVKDVAAYLRFLVNPRDEVSFKRVALLMPGIGQKTAGKLWEQIQAGKAWNEAKVPERAAESWKQWGETNRRLKQDRDHPSALIRGILGAVYEDYLKATYTNYLSRLEDLGQLQNFAQSFANTEDFLSQLALLTNLEAEGEGIRPGEGLRLSSIHQAKGLEFKIVFVIMLCDGLFPSSRSIENKDGEEEERRLFYVAATRAQDELYLTHPRRRATANQGEIYQEKSRFLDEIPRNLINTWRIHSPDPFSGHWG